MTLADARRQTLGKEHRALDDMSNEGIRRAQAWAEAKIAEQGEKPAFRRVIRATQLMLEARENGDLAAPVTISKRAGTWAPADPTPVDENEMPAALQEEDDDLPF